jgi:hypothetical protein
MLQASLQHQRFGMKIAQLGCSQFLGRHTPPHLVAIAACASRRLQWRFQISLKG